MNKKARAKYIREKLEELYPHPEVPLIHKDPYTLLVAVLLSAQSTDKRVNIIAPHLPDSPQKMRKLSLQELEAKIKPCGLGPTKAKAILGLSKIIEERGSVPDTFEELEALPGVGHKTASVVMAQAFHHPAFPVDTHIHRLAKRWRLSSGKNVVQTEKDLKELFPKKTWNTLHLQIIFYGREYCPARGHKLDACPICKHLSGSAHSGAGEN